MKRFDSKVAIVTGATSGIGAATARLLASEGASVVCIGRDSKRGEEVVDSITGKGGRAVFVRADVTKDAQVRSAVEKAVKLFGKIDVLFNNAGILTIRWLEKTTDDDWNLTIDTNLKSMFLFSKYAMPSLKKSKGAIVNTSSEMGSKGAPRYTAYCASKGGVIAFTKALALECAPFGIRANCISPGATETAMLKGEVHHYTSTEPDAFGGGDQFVDFLMKMIPLRRFSSPEDVANVVAFLASDDARQITGVNVPIDAGATA